MVIQWYIRANGSEKWKSLSSLFKDWLAQNSSLSSFGFSEGDAFSFSGAQYLCFCFPAHHGEKAGLFEQWAKTTGRPYGKAINGAVSLSNGESFILPTKPSVPVPPWLK